MSQDAVINVLATCSYALQRVIELMNAGSLVFSESEASEASECFHLHIKSYMWLAAFFLPAAQNKVGKATHVGNKAYLWTTFFVEFKGTTGTKVSSSAQVHLVHEIKGDRTKVKTRHSIPGRGTVSISSSVSTIIYLCKTPNFTWPNIPVIKPRMAMKTLISQTPVTEPHVVWKAVLKKLFRKRLIFTDWGFQWPCQPISYKNQISKHNAMKLVAFVPSW